MSPLLTATTHLKPKDGNEKLAEVNADKSEKTLKRTSKYEFHDLSESESADIVYFSSVSENTHRFIQKLDHRGVRIPLRPRREGMIRVAKPYVLVVPTYGGGEKAGAVPKQVIEFLNDPINRGFIKAVIPSGNMNFGIHYCIAGPIISRKCNVPELHRFELLGTKKDVEIVNQLVENKIRQNKELDLPTNIKELAGV